MEEKREGRREGWMDLGKEGRAANTASLENQDTSGCAAPQDPVQLCYG